MEKIKLLPTKEVVERLKDIFGRLHEIWRGDDYSSEEAEKISREYSAIRQEYDTTDIVFEVDGKLGVMDVEGIVTVPPIYKDYSETFSYDTEKRPVCACDFNDKYALVAADGKGTPLCDFEYDMIKFMLGSNNLYRSYKNVYGEDFYGVLDDKGNVLVPCEMDMVNPICNNCAYLFKDNKSGALMTDGLYFEPVYDDIYEKEGFLWAAIGSKVGLLNKNGEILTMEDAANLDEKDLVACFDY